jgi:hypothetical protein
VTIPVGQEIFSDPVFLRWAEMGENGRDGVDAVVDGHYLAVSIYVQGTSGPMTFHSTALAESFLSQPNAGDLTSQDDDFNLPCETNHFFFLDAIDVLAPADTRVLVGAGSSSVDGSITTPDNNDRFLNWMSRRLHAAYGNDVSVVNEGIGGDTAGIPPRCCHSVRCYLNVSAVISLEYRASRTSSSTRVQTTLATEFPRHKALLHRPTWSEYCIPMESKRLALPYFQYWPSRDNSGYLRRAQPDQRFHSPFRSVR